MRDVTTDARILSSSHAWSATPWEYSSMRFIRFLEDGGGELIYGYGQTIYTMIKCRWALPRAGVLHLTFLPSPPYQRFQGFTPDDSNRDKDLGYTLTEGELAGIESIVARPSRFLWTLELSGSPSPDGLQFPSSVPQVFYGHREEAEARPAFDESADVKPPGKTDPGS